MKLLRVVVVAAAKFFSIFSVVTVAFQRSSELGGTVVFLLTFPLTQDLICVILSCLKSLKDGFVATVFMAFGWQLLALLGVALGTAQLVLPGALFATNPIFSVFLGCVLMIVRRSNWATAQCDLLHVLSSCVTTLGSLVVLKTRLVL